MSQYQQKDEKKKMILFLFLLCIFLSFRKILTFFNSLIKENIEVIDSWDQILIIY
jgi:hypothetical protein